MPMNFSEIPESIKILEEQHKMLLSAQDEMEAMQRMMDMFQSQFQARYVRCQQKVKACWEEIFTANPNVNWEFIQFVPHPKEPRIIPSHIALGGAKYNGGNSGS